MNKEKLLTDQQELLANDLLISWGIAVRIDESKNAPRVGRMRWEDIVSGENDRKVLLPVDDNRDEETCRLMNNLRIIDKNLTAFQNAKRRARYEIARLRYVDCLEQSAIGKRSNIAQQTVSDSLSFIRSYLLARHSCFRSLAVAV